MRLADIGEGTPEPQGGENLLVEFGLSQLIDAINAEDWNLADDVIGGFPRSCCTSSDDIFQKLVKLRHEFEKTSGREVIAEDLDPRRRIVEEETPLDDHTA